MEETQIQEAYSIDKYLKELAYRLNRNYLEIARSLLFIHDNKFYEKLGYETFTEYIAQPELSFKRASVYKLMRIYKVFVRSLRVSPDRLTEIEWTKLSTTLPVVNENNYEDLLEKAETLSRSDLRQEVKIIKNPKEAQREKLYKTCPHCKGKGKIPLND